MTRGLHLSLTALLVVTFGVSSAFAFTPVLNQVPDVIISDQTPIDTLTPGQILTPGDTLEGQAASADVFDFPDAINIFDLVSDEPSTVAGFTTDENLIYTFTSSPSAPTAGGYALTPADDRISINGTRVTTAGLAIAPSASGELTFKDEAVSSDADGNALLVQGSLTYDFSNGAGDATITRDIVDANAMTLSVANPSGNSASQEFMVYTVNDGADAVSGGSIAGPITPVDLTAGATQWAFIDEPSGDLGAPWGTALLFPDFPGDTGVTGVAGADDDGDGSGNDLSISVPNTAGMSFTYWVSGGGDLPYVEDGVYRLTWNVASSGFAAATDAPVVRCRANYGLEGQLGNFELVNEIPASKPAVGSNMQYRMIIEEQDAASATFLKTSPNTNVAAQNELTLYFDVYDFNIGGDLGGGAMELESLTTELINRDALLVGALTEIDITDFTSGVAVNAANLDFSSTQDATATAGVSGVTMTSDVGGTAGGGTTNLGVLASDQAGELLGLPLLFDQASMGIIPFTPAQPSNERIYRASFTADTTASSVGSPTGFIVMSVQTNQMVNGSNVGQLYTAQMRVNPLSADATATNPGFDSGAWALYLQLPVGEALGASTGFGNGISSSLFLRDDSPTTGGTITVDGATIQSIDASLLP